MTKDLSSSDKLLFDTFLQNVALQKLLISKGLISQEEMTEAVKKQTAEFLKPFLEKTGVSSAAADDILENILNIHD